MDTMSKMTDALGLLQSKVTSKELPLLMKALKPAQSSHAMKVLMLSKSNPTEAEREGKAFVKSLEPTQVAELRKILGSDTVDKLLQAAA